MSEILKVELTDESGNTYYLKTDSESVYCTDGSTVETKLNSKINTSNIVQNYVTDDTTKVVSASVAKALNDLITGLQTSVDKINCESRERLDESADRMVTESNATSFYKINTTTATKANGFPLNNIAGCLLVMNLYATHVIQVFFALVAGDPIFIRHHTNINQTIEGNTWSDWRQI